MSPADRLNFLPWRQQQRVRAGGRRAVLSGLLLGVLMLVLTYWQAQHQAEREAAARSLARVQQQLVRAQAETTQVQAASLTDSAAAQALRQRWQRALQARQRRRHWQSLLAGVHAYLQPGVSLVSVQLREHQAQVQLALTDSKSDSKPALPSVSTPGWRLVAERQGEPVAAGRVRVLTLERL